MGCRGCTGTCCTGVGSDPCVCPWWEDDDEKETEVTKRTFTAPSGTPYTYEVDETGRFDKNSIIEYTDNKGGYATIAGRDLVALAIHWIEGEILELKADEPE